MKEDFEITLPEQDLCDLLSQRFDFVQDFQEADITLSAENFFIFSSRLHYTGISLDRFLMLMKEAEINPVLNEHNSRFYWLLKNKND